MTTLIKKMAFILPLTCVALTAQANDNLQPQPLDTSIAIASLQADLQVELNQLKESLTLEAPKAILPAEMYAGENMPGQLAKLQRETNERMSIE